MRNSKSKLLALESFGSESFLSLNKKLLSQFGPELSIYISNLMDKYKYFMQKDMLSDDDGFFLTHQQQSEQTGMNDYALRKCKRHLKREGLLTTELRGIPPKEFYFLDISQIVDLMTKKPCMSRMT